MKPKEKLAVIIPVFNEETCINELVKRILNLKESLDSVELSCIFVNDGSSDKSLAMLINYAQDYEFFKIINFSRNFGHQLAITAGLDYADSDYVIIMDADLQDPPEVIKKLYEKIKEGYDVVYAERAQRKGESYIKLKTAKWFYHLINRLGKVDIPPNTGDFRIINRKLHLELKRMREKHRFVRGMIPWLGFKSTALYYNRDKRYAGTTKYPFKRMLLFAMDALFSFSISPLRFASYVGFFVAFLGIIGLFVILFFYLVYDNYIPGVSATLFAILLMGGIQLIVTGIIGEYIGRIFQESKDRPLYVVESTFNFSNK